MVSLIDLLELVAIMYYNYISGVFWFAPRTTKRGALCSFAIQEPGGKMKGEHLAFITNTRHLKEKNSSLFTNCELFYIWA